jgi:hypothetical protein
MRSRVFYIRSTDGNFLRNNKKKKKKKTITHKESKESRTCRQSIKVTIDPIQHIERMVLSLSQTPLTERERERGYYG